VHTVVVVVSPQNAAVAVNGHPRQHRNGALELRGPLGSVFTVEAVANGSSIVQRVAVTDIGALPARLDVPAARQAASSSDECVQPFWRDAQDVRHYKPQCVAMEQYGEPDAPPRSHVGELTIVCFPKCDRIVDNGTELGPGHVFNRPVMAGRHRLFVSAPNGVKRNVVVEVASDETREVRLSMDPSRVVVSDLLSAPIECSP
jgi:hypothetical protein